VCQTGFEDMAPAGFELTLKCEGMSLRHILFLHIFLLTLTEVWCYIICALPYIIMRKKGVT